jgi:hypothetical protein
MSYNSLAKTIGTVAIVLGVIGLIAGIAMFVWLWKLFGVMPH